MAEQTEINSIKTRWIQYILELQNTICKALEEEDGQAVFVSDKWEREGGGGGDTRILTNGKIIEKGGVNSSVVSGDVTDLMRQQLKMNGSKWFACGLSLVIHPLNPYVPTVHANWRYFELYDDNDQLCDSWFGGGSDLTPYYVFAEDARHFHQVLKNALDPFGETWYENFKKDCDKYFSNTHRNHEMRGIGGVFYDQMRPADVQDAEKLFTFQQSNGNAFLNAYIPIVKRRKNLTYGQREIEWQEIRRGRYVEFNLIHDRGTLFGLKTNGRTESILMSLPPRARWVYDHHPEPGSEENKLLQLCLHPVKWI